MAHTENRHFMNIDTGCCMLQRISFKRINNEFVPLVSGLMRIECQLTTINDELFSTVFTLYHLFAGVG